MKKILGISLFAMMAVTTANAEIASKAFVEAQDNAVKALITSEATTRSEADNAITDKIGTIPTAGVGAGSANVIAYVDAKVANANSGTTDAINALNATPSQAASAENGQLALSVTQENGVITAVSGFIKPNTYDAYGAATAAEGRVNATIGTLPNQPGTQTPYATVGAALTAISGTAGAAVPVAQTAQNANKAMITNAEGNVVAGTIATGMITDGAVTEGKLDTSLANTINAKADAEDVYTKTEVYTKEEANNAFVEQTQTASTSEAGIIAIAGDADITDGTNTTKAVTPAQLKAVADTAAGNVTSTYSANGTTPVNGTAVAAALGTLDGGTILGTGVVKSISQADGQISATLSAVTDADVASGANINLNKLGMPALNNSTSGEYVLTANNNNGTVEYHWELISRTGTESESDGE